MISVVIADDHEIVRDGIRNIVSSRKDIHIEAEVSDGLEAIAAIKRFKPNILILDVSMPHASALEICIEAKRWNAATKVLVYTGIVSGSLLQELINQDVSSIVLKSDDIALVNIAIDSAVAGKSFYSQSAQDLLDSSSAIASLTSREKQVMQLIVVGNSNIDSSNLLSLSQKTVDNHRTNLMRKLKLHSVSELMAFAYREGLLAESSKLP
jgi:DNA-binding NarL/FixJ family response regulator